MATNPRYKNGNFRRKLRARFKAMNAECYLCKGGLGPIRYDQPSDAKHPLSLAVDERIPVSRWKDFGYDSPEAVCMDMNNVFATHYCCNQAKSDKLVDNIQVKRIAAESKKDGEW